MFPGKGLIQCVPSGCVRAEFLCSKRGPGFLLLAQNDLTQGFLPTAR